MGCFAIVTIFWYGLPIYSKQFEALNARDPNLSIACLPPTNYFLQPKHIDISRRRLYKLFGLKITWCTRSYTNAWEPPCYIDHLVT
jgi:hypothetical protein